MAFAAAAGWNNLPNGNSVPVIFSKKVQKFFRRAAVAQAITNTDYMGEIANYGDTVRIITEPTISVASYVRGQNVVPQDLIDSEIVLTIDKANSFAFKVDDIEARQSHIEWLDLATQSAAYSIKDTFDAEVLEYMRTQPIAANIYGSTGTPIDLGFASGEITPLQAMNRLSRLLDEQNVPTENRWLVANPEFWETMSDESSKLMGVDFTGDGASILRNGRVSEGMIRNFYCYRSNNLLTTNTSGTTWALAGHMSSTAVASQIAKTEQYRDPFSFADVVRGLHMYGRKTLRTNAIALLYFNVD